MVSFPLVLEIVGPLYWRKCDRKMWQLKFFIVLCPFPHPWISHTNGLLSLCVATCLSRSVFWMNGFLHSGQTCFFSPVCIATCRSIMNLLLKTLPQNEQGLDFDEARVGSGCIGFCGCVVCCFEFCVGFCGWVRLRVSIISTLSRTSLNRIGRARARWNMFAVLKWIGNAWGCNICNNKIKVSYRFKLNICISSNL